MNNTLGLYIHVPFCDGKCNYCDFFSFKSNEAELDKYTLELIDKLHLWSKEFKTVKVDTVYFGGGTPSLLGTERIVSILKTVHKCFKIASDCEITIEVNPSSHKEIDFSTLKNLGLNRVSLGMQSAIDEELKKLGRRHNIKDVINTVNSIKISGIDNISIDVMLGIPLQNEKSLLKTLDFCIELDVKHISTYMLTIEPSTYFGKNRDKYDFADEDQQAEFYNLVCNYLSEKGFEHYEISNFCKDGKISRHNMRYWELKDYLGIGPSAHSLINGKRFYYPADIKSFYNNIITEDGNGKTPEEYIMLMLRTNKGINKNEYEQLFGTALPDSFYKKTALYENAGYVKTSDNCIRLTEKGFLLSNTIIADLI